MSRPRLSRTTWITLLIFGVLSLFYLLVLSAAEVYYRPPAPALSTFGTDPNGMAAFYRYLAAEGGSPSQLMQFDELPPARGSVMIVAGALRRTPLAGEVDKLRRWVQLGGTLVLAAELENPFHSIAGIRPFDLGGGAPSPLLGQSSQDVEGVRQIQATRLTQGVRVAELDAASALEGIPDESVVEIGTSQSPRMMSRAMGKGLVVVLADEHALSNAGIGRADDLALALDLANASPAGARPARILFDEYHHGYAIGGGAWDKLPVGARASLVQLVIAALVLVAYRARRLGTPQPSFASVRTSPMEYVESLGSLLRRAHASRRAGEALARSFERELGARIGPGLRDRRAAKAVLEARGWHQSAAALRVGEAGVEDDKGLVALSRAVARARREVAGAGRRDRGARRSARP